MQSQSLSASLPGRHVRAIQYTEPSTPRFPPQVVVVDLLMRSKRTIFCVADLDPAAEAILATEPSSGAGKAGAGKADAGKASREPSAWNTTSGETAAGSSASTSTAPASQGPTARAAPSNAAGPYK